jgi:hypothetical protein
MAVVQGNLALASDFNTLKDEVNKWFGDSNPSMVFGAGDQTHGWGGSNAAAVVQGNLMQASEMNTLIDRINIGADIVNTVGGSLFNVSAGANILASIFNSTETFSDALSTGRLDIDAAELSLAAGGSAVRTNTWSALISCIFRYTFASFAKARYFFNSGGAFNTSSTITGYSTGTGWDGAGFNEIFTDMGTILMNYTQTTQSGAGGTPTSIGYYDLTTDWQLIFSQVGTGAYTDAVCNIYARYQSSGAVVDVAYNLVPGSGRSVNGTTTSTTQQRKLDNQSSGAASLTITAPTYSLFQNYQ